MGRLWQQIALMKHSPIFEYLSIETLIHERQKEYYSILEKCDRDGESTLFIEFSLQVILKSLLDYKHQHRSEKPKIDNRLQFALETFKDTPFTRKDYLNLFPDISTATASRDLANAVKENFLQKSGEKSKSIYNATRS